MTVLLGPGRRLHPAVVYLPFVVPAAWKCLPGITETWERLIPLLLSPMWKVLVAFSLVSLRSTPPASQRSGRPRSSPTPEQRRAFSPVVHQRKLLEVTVHAGTVLTHAQPRGIPSEQTSNELRSATGMLLVQPTRLKEL